MGHTAPRTYCKGYAENGWCLVLAFPTRSNKKIPLFGGIFLFNLLILL